MHPALDEFHRKQVEECISLPLDWNYLLHLAASHGVRPLLSRHLTENPAVPEVVADSLRRFALQNTRWNLRLGTETVQISAALEQRGVRHVLYKGPVLGEYLHGTTALRESSDIDLLVLPEQVFTAIRCLEELGFEDGFGLSARQRQMAVRFGYEYSFVRNSTTVDLHWTLGPKINWPSAQMELIWQQVVPFMFLGREVRIFCPEAMLSALCIHAGQHDWTDLKLFADVAQLLRRSPNLDWKLMKQWSANSHARRNLDVTLYLAQAFLGAELPTGVWETITCDPQVAKIADAVFQRWGMQERVPAETNLGWVLFRSKGERVIDRWRYLAFLVLHPTLKEFGQIVLPRPLAWGYWLWRPLRLVWKRLIRSHVPDA